MWTALGFTTTMLVMVVLQNYREWLSRIKWWMLPEKEKQRRIQKHLALVCRPAFGPKLFLQLTRKQGEQS